MLTLGRTASKFRSDWTLRMCLFPDQTNRFRSLSFFGDFCLPHASFLRKILVMSSLSVLSSVNNVLSLWSWVLQIYFTEINSCCIFISYEILADFRNALLWSPSVCHKILAIINYFASRKHTYSSILKILPPKNENFQIKNSDIFSYFCSKHRLWVLVRTASARRF